MTSESQGDQRLNGRVLFYKQPEPLSSEAHRNLGVKRIEHPYEFLSGTHIVPITVNEFGLVATTCPIIFGGPENRVPLAVMGARPGENVFLDAKSDPEPEMYLPAFVRRYPFVFASDDAQDRMIVCIDRQAAMVGENPDVPFFDGDQPSQFTNEAIEFCTEFERNRRSTEEFIKLLTEADVFEQRTVALTGRNPDGTETPPQKVADYWCVTEEKLRDMPADKFARLRESGALSPIYAHMVSLMHWPKVINRTLQRNQPSA